MSKHFCLLFHCTHGPLLSCCLVSLLDPSRIPFPSYQSCPVLASCFMHVSCLAIAWSATRAVSPKRPRRTDDDQKGRLYGGHTSRFGWRRGSGGAKMLPLSHYSQISSLHLNLHSNELLGAHSTVLTSVFRLECHLAKQLVTSDIYLGLHLNRTCFIYTYIACFS